MKDKPFVSTSKLNNLNPIKFGILNSLDGLVASELDTKKNEADNPAKKSSKHLIAVTRDEEGRIYTVESETNRFQSERDLSHYNFTGCFGEGWLPDRVMQDVPLFVSNEKVLARTLGENYSHLPTELTDLLEEGILRTSGTKPTDYSVLMSVTEHNNGEIPEGRTGVLLYKGKPVTVNIDGKDFVVEIKGVGCPDGNNSRIVQMCRSDYFGQDSEEFGGFDDEEGKREFNNLEAQRNTKTFLDGDSVRAAGVIYYITEKTNWLEETRKIRKKIRQAYLIRLTPSNIRSSFNQNPDFPKIKDREMVLTTSIGKQYAELAKLEDMLLHSTIHPENIVWTGSRYVLTDFADCRRLDQIDDPYDFISKVFNKIKEVPGITVRGVDNFYSTIANGLGVEWNSESGYAGFIEAIWSGFFAQKVYELRKGKTDNAIRQITAAKSLIERYSEKDVPLNHLFIDGAKHFLEQEIDLLRHIDTSKAKESLIVATERVAYLTTQLEKSDDINQHFKNNPNTYYDLFILPYMIMDSNK